jgi:alpha-1,3-fucosyltransferase
MKIVLKKTRTAMYAASNCRPLSQRQLIVNSLMKFVDVDLYGRCGNRSCELQTKDCIDIEKNYRFYLSFENTLCKDYVSEKVFKLLTQVVIPVVYNGANMTRFLPPKSVSQLSSLDFFLSS